MRRPGRRSRGVPPALNGKTIEIAVDDPSFLVDFFGPGREHIEMMEDALEICIGSRGNRILLQGSDEGVRQASRIITRFEALSRKGKPVEKSEWSRIIQSLVEEPSLPFENINGDAVICAPGGRVIAPKSPAQKHYVDFIRRSDIVFAVGPAGTGKTYLAVAMAISFLARRTFRRIILTRPAVEAGEKLGYLPGDFMEKVNPYLRPLYDALHDITDIDKSQSMIERGVIEVAPLAFMRGRTLNSSFIILDEAQNTTVPQMKMFLTRLGFDSKAVIAGDVTQIDIPKDSKSGLIDANERLQNIPGIDFAYFTENDVVRHPLVQEIIRRYEDR